MTQKSHLWARVIRSRHRDPVWVGRQENRERGRGSSGWWKLVTDIVEIRENMWLWEKARLKVGNGRDISL